MALRRRGRRARSGPLTVTHHPRSDRDALHVGFAVGRPVGPAVTRNRVRRRLRAAMRALDGAGAAPGPGDLLIAAGPESAAVGYGELVDHLRSAFAVLEEGSRP